MATDIKLMPDRSNHNQKNPKWESKFWGMKNYDFKSQVKWAFVLAIAVDGLWMFFSSESFFLAVNASAVFHSLLYTILSNILYPIILPALAAALYMLLSKEDKPTRKAKAGILSFNVFAGVVFWILGTLSVTVLPLGFDLLVIPVIGIFTGFGMSVANGIGKMYVKGKLQKDGLEYTDDTIKECVALFSCGMLSGPLFLIITEISIMSGIGLTFAQFAMMATAAFLISTVIHLATYKVISLGESPGRSVLEGEKSASRDDLILRGVDSSIADNNEKLDDSSEQGIGNKALEAMLLRDNALFFSGKRVEQPKPCSLYDNHADEELLLDSFSELSRSAPSIKC